MDKDNGECDVTLANTSLSVQFCSKVVKRRHETKWMGSIRKRSIQRYNNHKAAEAEVPLRKFYTAVKLYLGIRRYVRTR